MLHQCPEHCNMHRRRISGRSVWSLHNSIHRNRSGITNKHIHLLVRTGNTDSDTDCSCSCSMYLESRPVFLRDHLLCRRSKMCCGRYMYTIFLKLHTFDFSNWFSAPSTHERRDSYSDKYSFCHHNCTIHPSCNRKWKQLANNPLKK